MKSTRLHEMRRWDGLTPYVPGANPVPVPGIVNPAICTLGNRYMYGPNFVNGQFLKTNGMILAPSKIFRSPTDGASSYEIDSLLFSPRGSTVLFNAVFTTLGATADTWGLSTSATQYCITHDDRMRIFTAGLNLSGTYILDGSTTYNLFGRFEVDMTGLMTLSYDLYSMAGVLLETKSYSGIAGSEMAADTRSWTFFGTRTAGVNFTTELRSLWIHSPAPSGYTSLCGGT